MKNQFTLFKKATIILLNLVLIASVSFAQQPFVNRMIQPADNWQPNHQNTKSTQQFYELGEATITILYADYLFPYDISDNAQYIAIQGFGEGGSFLWSANGGMQSIPGQAFSTTENGKIGGTFPNSDYMYMGSPQTTAGTWLPETNEWTFLGVNPVQTEFFGPEYNSAWGMSGDGTVLAGMQWYPNYTVKAFKWTEGSGYSMIGNSLPLGSRANGVSNDGSKVFGWAETSFSSRSAVIWNGFDVIILNDEVYGEAFAGSPNSTYIVGDVGENNFIWSEQDGATLFSNTLNTGSMSSVAVANDGTVFGYTNEAWPPFPDSRRAFARLTDGTMLSFNDYAESRGMTEAQDWTFFSANAITADGNHIVGAAIDPQGNWVTFLLSFASEVLSYDLTLVADPVEGGVLTGEGTYEAGSDVAIEATPEADFVFVNWTDGEGNIISEEAATSIVMPENNLELTAHFNSTVGIANVDAGSSRLYPNPVRDQLHLKLNGNNTLVNVMDLNGSMLINQQIEGREAVINTNELSAGTYFIQMIDEKGTETIRFQVIK